MKIAVYPGSFDPITLGHLDVIQRGAKVFDKVIVGVLVNVNKNGLFDIEERVELIKKATKDIPNVEVVSFNGLLIEFIKQCNATVILKGLRALSDFEYEFQMALMNNKLDPEIETLFMMTSAQYSYISSSAIKQVAQFNGDLSGLVPEEVIPDIVEKINCSK